METVIKLLFAVGTTITGMWVLDSSEDRIGEMRESVSEVAPPVSSSSPGVVDTSDTLPSATRGVAVLVESTTTIPAPRVWDGPIAEYYGAGSGCTGEEANVVARAFWQVGASDETVSWALRMMSRESTCDPTVVNNNRRTGDDSWGLCQINALAGHFDAPDGIVSWWDRTLFAYDFNYNAHACAHLWTVCGRGPWTYGNYYCSTPDELR
jgi:hypothetical protein